MAQLPNATAGLHKTSKEIVCYVDKVCPKEEATWPISAGRILRHCDYVGGVQARRPRHDMKEGKTDCL